MADCEWDYFGYSNDIGNYGTDVTPYSNTDWSQYYSPQTGGYLGQGSLFGTTPTDYLGQGSLFDTQPLTDLSFMNYINPLAEGITNNTSTAGAGGILSSLGSLLKGTTAGGTGGSTGAGILGGVGSLLSSWLGGQSAAAKAATGTTTAKTTQMAPWGQQNVDLLQNLITQYLAQAAKERATSGMTPEQAAAYGPIAQGILSGGTPSEQQYMNILQNIALSGNYPTQGVAQAQEAVNQFQNYSPQQMKEQMATLYGPAMFTHGGVNEELIKQEVSRQAQAAQLQQTLGQWKAGLEQAQPRVKAEAANALMQIAPSRYSLANIMSILGMPQAAQQAQEARATGYETTAGQAAQNLLNQALGYGATTATTPTNLPSTSQYIWADLAKALGGASQGLLSSALGTTPTPAAGMSVTLNPEVLRQYPELARSLGMAQ